MHQSDASIFEAADYRLAFDEFRQLPPGVMDAYFRCLAAPSRPSGRALDVGCGPGIQSEMLLERFSYDWQIVGLEPSATLQEAASDRLAPYLGRTELVHCRFQEYQPRQLFDVVWLSEVAHLLGAPTVWTQHAASIMHEGARILVRTSTHAQLTRRAWYRFFPEALSVDLERHPDREAVVGALRSTGFSDVSVVEIDESRLLPSTLFVAMMQRRAFSTLHLISDAGHSKGIAMLTQELAGTSFVNWDYVMTAYTGTRSEG